MAVCWERGKPPEPLKARQMVETIIDDLESEISLHI